MLIPVLGVQPGSNYFDVFSAHYKLDLFTKERDGFLFDGDSPLIAHPPCAQWSKIRGLSKPDKKEKDFATFCWDLVNRNGGIFEHPVGSSFFKYVNADKRKLYKIDQRHFGFEATKATILYCHNVELMPQPLDFTPPTKRVDQLAYKKRSLMPLRFCYYLTDSIYYTYAKV